MKITHVYPHIINVVAKELFGAPQQPVGDSHFDEVWDEMRDVTLMGDEVLVPETNQFAADDVCEEMDKGRYDRSRLVFHSLNPITQTIHIPARGPYKSQLVQQCSLGDRS
jgi:hypothetical protein